MGTDWVEGGLTSSRRRRPRGRRCKELGISYACVSSGGNSTHQKIPVGPGYQVHLADEVKSGRASLPALSA